MGTFKVGCKVEHHSERDQHFRVPKLLVDTGSEVTWLPAEKLEGIGIGKEKKDVPFIMANDKPSKRDALAYYRGVASHFGLDVRQYETVNELEFVGEEQAPAWRLHTQHQSGARRTTI